MSRSKFGPRTEYCENQCGRRLTDPLELWRQKAMVAHILPKAIFPSVVIHPLNRWFACLQCHHDYDDKGWLYAETMPVWTVCLERYEQFMTALKVGEHRHLPESLRTLLDNSLTL